MKSGELLDLSNHSLHDLHKQKHLILIELMFVFTVFVWCLKNEDIEQWIILLERCRVKSSCKVVNYSGSSYQVVSNYFVKTVVN